MLILTGKKGRLRTIRATTTCDGSALARALAQAEEKVQDHPAGLARARYASLLPCENLNVVLMLRGLDILSAMVQEEMNEKEGLWQDIPTYLFETAKVLLDVYVPRACPNIFVSSKNHQPIFKPIAKLFSSTNASPPFLTAHPTTYPTRLKSAQHSNTSATSASPKSAQPSVHHHQATPVFPSAAVTRQRSPIPEHSPAGASI